MAAVEAVAVVAAVGEMVVEEAEGEILPVAEVTALWRLPLILVVEVEVALMVRRVLPQLYCWGVLFLILCVLWLHKAWPIFLLAWYVSLSIVFLYSLTLIRLLPSIDDIIELTQFRTEEAVQVGAAIDPQGKRRQAGEEATVMVLGDSVSTCVSAPVRRVVRRRDLRSADLSGDAIELLRRRQRKRLLWSVVPSLSQSKCAAKY